MKHIVAIFTALATGACIGPNPSLDIADVGSMPAHLVRQAWAVHIADALPVGATTLGPVKGMSCKSKAWDPLPSEARALEQLQIKAVEAGATGLSEVQYVKREFSVVTNCWATITASAMAYR